MAKQLFTERYDRTGFFERAVLQKPKEWIIATRLERQYTKDEIIALYLNRYDFLNQAVGIRSAAQVYFGKSVHALEVHESAMLVGMLKNSALYNPLRRPESRGRAQGHGLFPNEEIRGVGRRGPGQSECPAARSAVSAGQPR